MSTEHWSSGWVTAKLFSMLAVLESMPSEIKLGRDFCPEASLERSVPATRSVLEVGLPELERALPGGGLPQGQVVELQLASSSSLGTRLCFGALRAAQEQAVLQGGEAWCAFVDPEKSLYAPALVQAGVDLERLLVVQPEPRALSRVVIQLVEARAFSVIVVDLGQVRREFSTREWSRAVRRMALAIENTKAVVVLLTSATRASGALSGLPVGLRVRLRRQTADRVSVAITKDKQGRVRDAESVQFSAGRSALSAGRRRDGAVQHWERESSLEPAPKAPEPAQSERRLAKAPAVSVLPQSSRRGSNTRGSNTRGSNTRGSNTRGSSHHPRNVRHRLGGLPQQVEPQLSLLGGA